MAYRVTMDQIEKFLERKGWKREGKCWVSPGYYLHFTPNRYKFSICLSDGVGPALYTLSEAENKNMEQMEEVLLYKPRIG